MVPILEQCHKYFEESSHTEADCGQDILWDFGKSYVQKWPLELGVCTQGVDGCLPLPPCATANANDKLCTYWMYLYHVVFNAFPSHTMKTAMKPTPPWRKDQETKSGLKFPWLHLKDLTSVFTMSTCIKTVQQLLQCQRVNTVSQPRVIPSFHYFMHTCAAFGIALNTNEATRTRPMAK